MEKHLTATVYLVAKIAGKIHVLLHKHKKIGIWIGVGGHVEPNENPLETFYREVQEEAGVTPILLPKPKKFSKTDYFQELPSPPLLFEFKLSPYTNEPAHYHIDFVYFGTVPYPNKIRMQEDFRWFSAAELPQLDLQKETIYITKQALSVGRKYL